MNDEWVDIQPRFDNRTTNKYSEEVTIDMPPSPPVKKSLFKKYKIYIIIFVVIVILFIITIVVFHNQKKDSFNKNEIKTEEDININEIKNLREMRRKQKEQNSQPKFEIEETIVIIEPALSDLHSKKIPKSSKIEILEDDDINNDQIKEEKEKIEDQQILLIEQKKYIEEQKKDIEEQRRDINDQKNILYEQKRKLNEQEQLMIENYKRNNMIYRHKENEYQQTIYELRNQLEQLSSKQQETVDNDIKESNINESEEKPDNIEQICNSLDSLIENKS
jgi:hypothetical protein